MKFFGAALAAALVVSSAGCTAMRSCGGCGDTIACGAACGCSERPSLFGNGCCCGGWNLFGRCGNQGCGCGEACGDCCGECGSGCCLGHGEDCHCKSCLQSGISHVIDCSCGRDNRYNFAPGPPVGQVAYPYYTVRGPRDFLLANPPTIGPR